MKVSQLRGLDGHSSHALKMSSSLYLKSLGKWRRDLGWRQSTPSKGWSGYVAMHPSSSSTVMGSSLCRRAATDSGVSSSYLIELHHLGSQLF
eukprot:14297722-Heterocapsa_arctica.AAC.1